MTAHISRGEGLQRLRHRAGLTARRVEELSQEVARAERQEEFRISHTHLIQIENNKSVPSVRKLFTLSAIYCARFDDVLSLYVDPARITEYHIALGLRGTRILDSGRYRNDSTVTFPIHFSETLQTDKTDLLSRMIDVWGDIPVELLLRMNIRKTRYALIGLADYTMYPLLRPGSFVQVEEQGPPSERLPYSCELDRAIWFLELRDGYLCSWCDFVGDRIISIPHPLSPCHTREFAFPRDAEVVGRVTAVAARLVDPIAPRPPRATGHSANSSAR